MHIFHENPRWWSQSLLTQEKIGFGGRPKKQQPIANVNAESEDVAGKNEIF